MIKHCIKTSAVNFRGVADIIKSWAPITEAEREAAMKELIEETEYVGGLPKFEDTKSEDED